MYESAFPHGLMFHFFHDDKSPGKGQGSIMPQDLEAILDYVGIDNILEPDEWLSKLEHNQLGHKDLCLTFDDGLACQFDIAMPILDRHGLKAFFFVYSSVFKGEAGRLDIYSYFRASFFENVEDFYALFFKRLNTIGTTETKDRFHAYKTAQLKRFPFYSENDVKFRYFRDHILTREQYLELMDACMVDMGVNPEDIQKKLWLTDAHLETLHDSGHRIGLHSYDHPTVLSDLSYKEQEKQYARNQEHLYNVINEKIVTMSHPCNSYNTDTLKILHKMGIQCGFLSNMYPVKNKHNPSCLEMAREDCANILVRIDQRSKK